MSSSSSIILDGVEFKLCDAFKVNAGVELPPEFDLKDPEVVLEDCEYDFSAEHHLIISHRDRENKIKEELEVEKRKKEQLKRDLTEKHRQFLLQKQDKTPRGADFKDKNQNQPMAVSSNNPFLKDMVGSNILTPQQYFDDKHDSPQHRSLDVHEFEIANQDPFSNMEIQSIDDLKELQDVLQNVTMSGIATTTETVTNHKPVPRVRHHSPTNMNEEVTSKVTKKNEQDDVGISSNKIGLLDKFTDLLTEDAVYTQESPESSLLENKTPTIEFPSSSTSPLPYLPPVSNRVFLPPISAASSMPSLPNADTGSSLPANRPLSSPNTEPNVSVTADFKSISQNNGLFEESETFNSAEDIRKSPTFLANVDYKVESSSSSKKDYNVSYDTQPFVSKPIPRTANRNIGKSPESSNSKTNNSNSVTYGAVKNKVLGNKSVAERAKFEETINKALTSLPQLPQSVGMKKSQQTKHTENSHASVSTLMSHGPGYSGLLSGLSATEKSFVHSFVSMGFNEYDVIRTMQKFGEDRKEVLDHLFKVQCLSEKGFSKESIEESLELYNEDEVEAAKYLTLERQFLDMGFSCDRIKQALLLHNRDQTKALEELMSGV